MKTKHIYLTGMICHAVTRSLTEYPHLPDVCKKAGLHLATSPSHLWRPLLCCSVWKALTSQPYRRILPIACSAEIAHVASMMLDDLPMMDNAEVRRGKVTCHLLFGTQTTLLSVFALCDVADALVHTTDFSREHRSAIKQLLLSTRAQMYEGQLMDLSAKRFSPKEVFNMYACKSGALYAYALASPAIALGRLDMRERLIEMGKYLGIAYQVADDIFDVEGASVTLGKGTNMDKGKSTLPRVIGLSEAKRKKDALKRHALTICRQLFGKGSQVEELMQKVVV